MSADMLVMNGFDDCIVGVVDDCFCYSREKVIEKLMTQGMDRQEAIEFHYFNQAGAGMGEGTPVYLDEPDEGESPRDFVDRIADQ